MSWRPLGCNTKKNYIVAEGATMGRHTVLQSCDTRYSARGCDMRDSASDTARGKALCHDMVLQHGAPACACAQGHFCDTTTTRSGSGCETTGGRPRHGAWCATTQPTQRAACTQPKPRVYGQCALDPFLTQDTVLSHYLGSLFMNTVHEILKKNK